MFPLLFRLYNVSLLFRCCTSLIAFFSGGRRPQFFRATRSPSMPGPRTRSRTGSLAPSKRKAVSPPARVRKAKKPKTKARRRLRAPPVPLFSTPTREEGEVQPPSRETQRALDDGWSQVAEEASPLPLSPLLFAETQPAWVPSILLSIDTAFEPNAAPDTTLARTNSFTPSWDDVVEELLRGREQQNTGDEENALRWEAADSYWSGS